MILFNVVWLKTFTYVFRTKHFTLYWAEALNIYGILENEINKYLKIQYCIAGFFFQVFSRIFASFCIVKISHQQHKV